MQYDEPFDQQGGARSFGIELEAPHQEVYWIESPSLCFADKRPPRIGIVVPKRKAALMDRARNELRPRISLVGGIGISQDRIFMRKQELPKDRNREDEKECAVLEVSLTQHKHEFGT